MKVLVKVYNTCKYNVNAKVAAEIEYEIEGFEVKEITDKEIYKLGFDDVDPYGEYLILTINGEQSTFRNSLVDMFKI